MLCAQETDSASVGTVQVTGVDQASEIGRGPTVKEEGLAKIRQR